MSEQFALDLDGPARRDAGIARATANTPDELRLATQQAIDLCASYPYQFTAEDVRRVLERDGWDLTGMSPGFLGAALRTAAAQGRIRTHGMTIPAARADAHARRLLLWGPVRTDDL